MPPPAPAWVSAAQHQPIAFAQVREDPLIDRWVVDQCARTRPALAVTMVASGGCTAAFLAGVPGIASLHLVDPNPAQLALARVKLWLLAHRTPAERMAILGHATMPAAERAQAVRAILASLGLADSALGSPDLIARLGPDHAGRYEALFAALREHLRPVADQVRDLLTQSDTGEQQRRSARGTALGLALDQAFLATFRLEHLVGLFGAAATGNAAMPFPLHFLVRLRHVLATRPAASNPWLWQLLLGTYPAAQPVPWLALPTPARLPAITCAQASMDDALAPLTGTQDVVHLSNILDWLTPAQATRTLELARDALRPGGRVVIRQLNSTLEIPELVQGLEWIPAYSGTLNHFDRSFFYRDLHVGTKA